MADASDASADDDMDWEEVLPVASQETGDIVLDHFDLSLQPGDSAGASKIKGKKLDDKERERLNFERVARHTSHKLHAVALLANASVRNNWLNDPLLHARLMSLAPISLQNHFQMVTKKNQPDAGRRGRLFEAALGRLTEWWYDNFDLDTHTSKNVRSRTFAAVQNELKSKNIPLAPRPDPLDFSVLPTRRPKPPVDRKGKGKQKMESSEEEEEEKGEIIRSSKSLMKHALMMRGTRDTSAQLFTALCRSLGLPSRLVVSLQAVPWKSSTSHDTTKTQSRGNALEKTRDMSEGSVDSDDELEPVIIATEGSATPSTYRTESAGAGGSRNLQKRRNKFPGGGQTLGGSNSSSKGGAVAELEQIVRLRRSRPFGNRLGGANQGHAKPPSHGWPPVFWTEVFSRPDGRWIPVDPSRNLVNKKRFFAPPPNDKNNRLVYVIGFEEDGYAKDVTPRYAKDFGAKTAKLRVSGARGRKDWWESVAAHFARPFRLNRDDVEDAELLTTQVSEGMPSSVAGFKDHPLYVLERHLKREEVIHPHTEVGKFRGEPVFSRRNLVTLKTAENWMRQGREIKEGAQPLKMVKLNAVTIARKRAIEMAAAEAERTGGGRGESLQAMYAEWQTKWYLPPPVKNGKVPKNDFGNIDLYTPTMLPAGAVHLPYKGIAKVARKLGIDFAEAVTGFEFKNRRALPTLTGIVIPREHEAVLMDAYRETAQAEEQRERQKLLERVLKRWTKIITGLRIRARLKNQYSSYYLPEEGNQVQAAAADDAALFADPDEEGGFLLNEHDVDVVQPHHLPKMLHLVGNAYSQKKEMLDTMEEGGLEVDTRSKSPAIVQEVETEESRELELGIDEGQEEELAQPQTGKPQTMEEYASKLLAEQAVDDDLESSNEEWTPSKKSAKAKARQDESIANSRPRRSVTKRQAEKVSNTRTPTRARYPRKAAADTAKGKKRKASRLSASASEEDEVSGSEGSVAGSGTDTPEKEKRPTRPRRSTRQPAPVAAIQTPAPSGGRTLRPRKSKGAH